MRPHLLAVFVLAVFAAAATAQDQSASQILAEIENLQAPEFDQSRAGDPEYLDEFQAAFEQRAAQEAELIWRLYQADPVNPALDDLLEKLWARTAIGEHQIEGYEPLEHLQAYLDAYPDGSVARHARLYLGLGYLYQIQNWEDEDFRELREKAFLAIDDFIEHHPEEEIAFKLKLVWMKFRYIRGEDSDNLRPIYRQVIEVAPNTKQARWATGRLRQLDSLGQPFELEFDDLLTEERIDVQDLDGQIVVIIFWASYSPPCQEAVAEWVKLFDQFHDLGVAFIGISADVEEERLRDYLEEKEITWPQYWAAKESTDFAESWGVLELPHIFVLDESGNLVDLESPERLRDRIANLLAKRDDRGDQPLQEHLRESQVDEDSGSDANAGTPGSGV